MPEIAEVARTVHYIRKFLVGKTLDKVTAIEDQNVFGKVGTSHTEIMKHLTGKKVIDAGQQGWLKMKDEHTYYNPKKGRKDKEEWPPKYWKFHVETDGKGDEKIEAAFVDARRFGRVRLVDCPGKEIRNVSPLVENGPDPVIDKDEVTVAWLQELCHRKKVPIKAMLLDQANISGIGNWVGDEIMYNAKMHPEQYANTLSDAQIKQLHKSIHYVCDTACELLADSSQFPKDWLFKHRWGKGRTVGPKTLPSGEKIVFLTVGGRTSAVVPSVQKKTGPVAKEMSEAEEDENPKKGKGKGNKRVKEEESDEKSESEPPPKKTAAKKKKSEVNGEAVDEESKINSRGKKSKVTDEAKSPKKATAGRGKKASSDGKAAKTEAETTGRRRSGRLR